MYVLDGGWVISSRNTTGTTTIIERHSAKFLLSISGAVGDGVTFCNCIMFKTTQRFRSDKSNVVVAIIVAALVACRGTVTSFEVKSLEIRFEVLSHGHRRRDLLA